MLRALKITIFALLAATVIATSFGAGYIMAPTGMVPAPPILAGTSGGSGGRNVPANAPEQFRLLDEVWEILRSDFVEPNALDPDKLGKGALDGLIAALGDSHTSFIDAENFRAEQSGIRGSYEGIGAHVQMDGGAVTVVAPLPGSPAEQAGIRPGDKILSVNGEALQGGSLQDAVNKIKGPKGTKVTLSVLHQGDNRPETVDVLRSEIRTASVAVQMLPNNIAHLRISQFSQRTGQEVQDALRQARGQNARGLILDLRNNPGGLLDQTVEVTSQFLEGGIAGYQVNRNGDRAELRLRGRGESANIPLVVLVNGGSASGSELLAGAMQDRDRAVLIGTKTFGKGSVNHLRELSDGSALYVTIGRWLTPKGRQIEGNGLAPDIEVQITEDDVRNRRDAQLERAVQVIQARSAAVIQ